MADDTYTKKIQHKVIYSTGDMHGQGRRVVAFLDALERQSVAKHEHAAFIQILTIRWNLSAERKHI